MKRYVRIIIKRNHMGDPLSCAAVGALVMMAAIGSGRRGIASQGGFFFQIFSRFRIESLHLVKFFRCQLWEMANEVDQLPTVLVLRWITLSPGRHGGEADTIVDHPEDLAVHHRLSVGQS